MFLKCYFDARVRFRFLQTLGELQFGMGWGAWATGKKHKIIEKIDQATIVFAFYQCGL